MSLTQVYPRITYAEMLVKESIVSFKPKITIVFELRIRL